MISAKGVDSKPRHLNKKKLPTKKRTNQNKHLLLMKEGRNTKMSKEYRKVFVTVGTTRFDLLCETIITAPVLDSLKSIGCKEVVLQMGNSEVSTFSSSQYLEIEGVRIHCYKFKDSIQDDIRSADLVISHAGAGTCLETLEAGKPLLAVVNEDLMDDHQIELAQQFQVDGHLYYCTCDTLANTLEMVDFGLLKPFPKPNASLFVHYLDSVLKVKSDVD